MTDHDPIRARELARNALQLETTHARAVADALAPIRAATGGDDATLRAVLQDAADAPDDGHALAVFEAAAAPAPAPRAVPASKVAGNRPERLLHAAGKQGALLSVGGVLLLAGEGGVAKSPLALAIAAGMAARPDGDYGDLHGGLFAGTGAPVLVASYEDWPSVSADRLRRLADAWWPTDPVGGAALDRVHLLDLSGAPLFGPVAPADDRAALYNARPGPLDGWRVLWAEARRIGARLVVIDPALAAYVGNANEAAPVRELIGAMIGEAAPDPDADWRGCGVLMVAHSRKEARGKGKADPFDPGMVAGSTHWTDAARGVLTLTFDPDGAPGARVLAISKANYGPSRILASVDPVRARSGEIVGFAGGPWQTEAERETAQDDGDAGGPIP